MKVYVINLAKNTERLARIKTRLDQLHVDFERVEAVNGRDMCTTEKRLHTAAFKWWCIRGTFPRDGEIGCALSHMDVYRRLVCSGDPCCCVLEDDDTILDGFVEQLNRIEQWIASSRPQVLLMTNYSETVDPGRWEVVQSVGDTSTEAYVITRQAAINLLHKAYPVFSPSDGWRFWVSRGWIEIFHAFPTMVPSTWQNPGYTSDVCPEGEKVVRVSEMTFVKKVLWKFGRVVGRCLSYILI